MLGTFSLKRGMAMLFNNTLSFKTKQYSVSFFIRGPSFNYKIDNSVQVYLPSNLMSMSVVPIDKMYIKNASRYYFHMNYKETATLAFWKP